MHLECEWKPAESEALHGRQLESVPRASFEIPTTNTLEAIPAKLPQEAEERVPTVADDLTPHCRPGKPRLLWGAEALFQSSAACFAAGSLSCHGAIQAAANRAEHLAGQRSLGLGRRRTPTPAAWHLTGDCVPSPRFAFLHPPPTQYARPTQQGAKAPFAKT